MALPWLSVVIPTLGDLGAARAHVDLIGEMDPSVEVVLAGVVGLAEAEDDVVQVLAGRQGRGHQIVAGIAATSGETLLIHHADNALGPGHLGALRQALEEPAVRAGSFYRDVCDNWPGIAFADPLARWWAREWGILYGDQSVFIRREFLEELGGFPDIPLMEDVELSWRIRSRIRPTLLDPPITASMRRFRRMGKLRNKISNLLILSRYALGESPERLYESYYGAED